MPPRKKQRAAGKTAKGSSLVADLPLTAGALIYEYCDAATRNSLLRVSKWGRDLVLREAKTINVRLGNSDTPAARKPLVRLLSRACSDRGDGRLTLSVHGLLGHNQEPQRNLLKDLLAGGTRHCRWTSVSTLKLCVSLSATSIMMAGRKGVLVQQEVAWM
jgi:hypothetical protein